MNKIITHIVIMFLLLVAGGDLYAQKKTVLGKVVSKSRDLEGIYIKNINTNKATLTQKGGYFSIDAHANDTLIFSAVHLIGREKVVSPADMNKSLVFVPMEYAENVLDEIIIDRTVTTESLGLGGARKLTPAQRRLYRATSSGGGIIPIDAIVNAISGRTKMLEKAADLEQEEFFVKRLLNKFNPEFYTEKLNIPSQYYMAFGYFLAQDTNITSSYQTVDITQLNIMYTEKAVEFLEIVRVLK